MLRIGITGGIGSGKSTVCGIFESLGVPVFHSDTEAKSLYNTSAKLKKWLSDKYGDVVFTDGVLNREALAAVIFRNEADLKELNAVVHPLVNEAFTTWCDQHLHSAYVLKEAAILFESGSYKDLDFVIGVLAPESLRIERTVLRDHSDPEKVKKRMEMQMNQAELAGLCDFLIVNDGVQALIPQVLSLHKELLTLSGLKGS